MAEKRPLCLYTGNVKQIQPGDTILGAYNATEAGWTVNASGWLVATPGSAKMTDRVVCGSISPVTGNGVKILNLDGNTVLKTADGTGVMVALGSAAEPTNKLHLQEKGTDVNYIQFTNDTTGHTSGDGLVVGISAAEMAYIDNKENTDMRFYTNALHRMTIRAAGTASIANASMTLADIVTANIITASMNAASSGTLTMRDSAILYGDKISARDSGGLWLVEDGGAGIFVTDGTAQVDMSASLVVRGNASVDGSLSVGGIGVFGNTVTITADVQVAAGQKFYMDGGTDTYWTASNDIITGHVNSASVVAFKSTMAHFSTNASVDLNLTVGGDLIVTGSVRVVASTLYLGDNQLGNAAGDTQLLYGNVAVYNAGAANPMRITGNASISGTGYVAGTFGVGGHTSGLTASLSSNVTVGGILNTIGAITGPSAVIPSFDSTTATIGTLGGTTYTFTTGNLTTGNIVTMNATDVNTNIASIGVASITTITMRDSGIIYGDQMRARDSGGLMLYDDSGAAGLQIANGGVSTFTHGLIANSTASVGGTLKTHGIFTALAGVVHNTTLTQTGVQTSAANLIVNATVIASAVIIGGTGKARLVNCTLNASGDITVDGGTDLMLNAHDDTSPNQEFIAEKVWNAVYNDVVDWQDLKEGAEVKYGKVYVDSYDGAHLPTGRCELGVMGICSDTFGFAVGRIQGRNQIPVSVSGWCLAYVDKMYKTGIPLTNTSSGCLTEMNATEKMTYPERLVAVYKRPEHEDVWQGRVETKNRHWVQVK